MKKKKYLLTAGCIGQFRNGVIFTSNYLQGIGHILMCNDNSKLDIIAIWKPANINDLTKVVSDPSYGMEFLNFNIPFWTEPKPVSDNVIDESVPNDNNHEISVRTEIFVEINGKPVDMNNLTEKEYNTLNFFGIIQ